MNRIDKRFRQLKKEDKKAFIAYITAGDGGLDMTGRIVLALEAAGVDIIELGIPFSDPLADGPTIQAASQRALKNNVNLTQIFKTVSVLRKRTDIPLVFMTYYNPVFKYGIKKFVASCVKSGVDGMIIPDLPFEEAQPLVRLARRGKVATIFLAAPTSSGARIKAIVKNSTGFIYYVSLTGVTGARKNLPAELSARVKAIRYKTGKPVCVGFGVSNARQAAQIAKTADGVIIGSAIVKIIGENKNVLGRVARLAKGLAGAIHG